MVTRGGFLRGLLGLPAAVVASGQEKPVIDGSAPVVIYGNGVRITNCVFRTADGPAIDIRAPEQRPA